MGAPFYVLLLGVLALNIGLLFVAFAVSDIRKTLDRMLAIDRERLAHEKKRLAAIEKRDSVCDEIGAHYLRESALRNETGRLNCRGRNIADCDDDDEKRQHNAEAMKENRRQLAEHSALIREAAELRSKLNRL